MARMAAVSDAPGERGAALAAALAKLRQGDIAAADAACRRLLQGAPRDPALHQLAAAIALRRGDAGEAARWAGSSLELRPAHPPTLLLAGRAARMAGERRPALGFFRDAARLAPERGEAAFLICITLLELGDGEAQAMLEHLLERFPDDAEGWSALGAALHQADQLPAALIAFTRAARAAPSPATQLRRGAVLQSLGRPADAAEAFRAALALAPDNVDAALKLGLCLRQAGDLAGAGAALERAVALDPARAPSWFALGLARQDGRDFAGAVAAYRRALALRPELAEAAVNLGIALQQSGDLAAAKAAYAEALRLRGDSFGRIAQALAAAPTGEVWLDLGALRRSLGG
jgi:tetratricopeptide (TPR) repeat protein